VPEVTDFQSHREAAQRRMQRRRDAAFLFGVDYISDLPVRPLSLRLWLILDAMGSVFATGKFPSSGDDIGSEIRRFLWAVSVDFSHDKKERTVFLRRVDKLDAMAVLVDIRDYLDRAFADSPYNQGCRKSVPHASVAAEVVDHFATQYGWTPDVTLNLPLAQLWQLRNCIASRTQKQPVFANREVDQSARDWLKAQGN